MAAAYRSGLMRGVKVAQGFEDNVLKMSSANVPSTAERPAMSRGKAALVYLLYTYSRFTLDLSIVEVQKLMYLLQEAGEPLKLAYVKDRYGPYAHNLDHVLQRIEGHFLSGFGDGSGPVATRESLVVFPEAFAQAAKVVEGASELHQRIESVMALVRGFEAAYDLELLATIHWVATRDNADAASDVALAGELVRSWSPRKQGLFGQAHVENAWNALRSHGWFEAAA